MKKISAWIVAVFLGASLALAQNTGGDKNKLNPQPLPPGKKATATTTKKSHKGGKKGGAAPPPAAPPVPPPPPPLQVGDAVVVSQRGVFFPATITAAGSGGAWKIRFEGSATDEEVAADRVKRASLPGKGEKLQPNQLVLIEWHGLYVPGKVLKEQDKGQYKVRFDGQGPEADEIVPVKRLRLR